MFSSLFGTSSGESSPVSTRPMTPVANNMDDIAREDLARILVKRSSLSKIFPELTPELLQALPEQIKLGRTYPDPHPDSVLINMASHPCVINWTQNALAEIGDSTGYLAESRRQSIINGVALVLAQGFDKVQEPNPRKRPFFQRDPTGKIIGILNTEQGMPNARFAQCHELLKTTPLLGGKRRKTLRKKLNRNVHRLKLVHNKTKSVRRR
jgi:hypothetical protein